MTQRSRPLRVLHLTYDMRIGGTEQVIRNLIEASDPDRIIASIFCIEAPLGPWGEGLREAGTPVHGHARRPGFDMALVRSLRRHLLSDTIDIVHCHQYTPWVYGALAAAGLRCRVVFTEHGRFYPDVASPKRRFINPLLARLTDRLTAISAATRQALGEFEYLQTDRIKVIYNGIRGVAADEAGAAALRAQLGIPEHAPVFGTVARFDPIKNHPMMLWAFQSILKRLPEAWLLLVGDGEERPRLEALIGELGIESRVILPGYRSEPGAWLNTMDVFLLSSFSEGTSMTLLEALSLGKPCVVTDVGGNPEIIANGETGFVTPSDDAEAFAAAMFCLAEDRSLRDRLSSAARLAFETRFTAIAMARAYLRLYAEL